MSAEEKATIEATALAVPVALMERCHAYITAVNAFLPQCNPNITSDAKVGIHQLAGAARAECMRARSRPWRAAHAHGLATLSRTQKTA